MATGFERFQLYAGSGNDILTGGSGRGEFYGGAANDTLTAGSGGGSLSGEAGNDILTGGTASDGFSGGVGDDRMTGGLGADNFEFNYWENTGTDTITDLVSGVDKLVFDTLSYTSQQVDIGGDGRMDLRLTLSNGGTINLLGVSALGPNDVYVYTSEYAGNYW